MSKLYNVSPDAKIGINVKIEPFATIQGDVVIGDNCWIGSGAVIMDGVRMGENTKIFPGAIVGAVPQDLKFNGEPSTVEIGNNVVIREYCTINRGTEANMTTKIGDNCLLMAYVHVAHDCVIGKNCILANNATLGGHIEIGDFAVLGGMTAIHQFCRVGKHVMLAGGCLVNKDIPPYTKAARSPLSYAGVNSTGLKRRGFTFDDIHQIQDIYRILFVRGHNFAQAVKFIETEVPASDIRDEILEFVQSSKRGIMKGFKSINGSKNR